MEKNVQLMTYTGTEEGLKEFLRKVGKYAPTREYHTYSTLDPIVIVWSSKGITDVVQAALQLKPLSSFTIVRARKLTLVS